MTGGVQGGDVQGGGKPRPYYIRLCRTFLLSHTYKEDHDATNHNAITMYQEIGIIYLHLIDNHTIGASKVPNIETIWARNYFCMPARSCNVSEYNITRLVPSKRNTFALLQMNYLWGTRSNDDKCRFFLKSGHNVCGKCFCRSWKQQLAIGI